MIGFTMSIGTETQISAGNIRIVAVFVDNDQTQRVDFIKNLCHIFLRAQILCDHIIFMILQKLTEMFPEIEFKHQWADEDIGYNCGQRRYHGGERTDEFYPESEFDRIRFSTEVLEVDPQEYGLFLNESNTAFIQLPDEDFELIEVAGQTALFTENRYVDETVPMGLHCYQLRHSDYGANFISLERRVGVNFGGTVITKECIDLGREQCIEFDEETEPNFLSERCQMEDFIAGDYGQEEEMEMEVTPV